MKQPPKTVRVINDDGLPEDVTEVGVPGMFNPQDEDIFEELQDSESLREYQRDYNPFDAN